MPIGAVIGAAAIGGAASLAGGAMQANAANQAAQTQAQAADKSLALQEKQFNQSREDSMPWMTAGKTALEAYMGELGLSDSAKAGTFESGFQKTPGYQFQMDQGREGVQNSLAALGMKNSGAGLKAITKYSQGVADQGFNNYLDRLSGVSTGGQAQVSQNNALGQNAVAQMGQTIQDKGAATASGYVGGANAWSNALSNVSKQAGFGLGMASGNFGQGWGYVNPNAGGNAVMKLGYNL